MTFFQLADASSSHLLRSRGTLTCRADSNLQTIEYAQCPNALQGLTIQELIDQVPGMFLSSSLLIALIKKTGEKETRTPPLESNTVKKTVETNLVRFVCPTLLWYIFSVDPSKKKSTR